jgi:PAS domain S-box-containing protein
MNLGLPALRQHTARLADHLRLSDTLLQAQTQMGDGLLIIEGHRIVYANGAAAEISGYAVDDLLSLGSVFDLIPMDERRRLAHRLDRAVSLDRIRNHCESTIVRRDGRRVDLELSVQHVPVAHTDARRVVVIARDVTDRKAMERALRSSEARYRLLFDSTVAGLCVSTIEGRLIQCNTAFARMLGFGSAEEALADPQADFDLASPEGGTILGQLRTHEAVVDFEIPLRRRDGSTAWALGNATLLDRFDDGPALVETILIDVTGRRALQAQLYESQKMDAIGRLASGVAHDFNNLLTAIQGYSELALSDLGNHPLRAQIEEIGRAAQRATALTRQLLAFSRRQAESLCVVDLHTVVRSMLNLLRRLIGEDFDLVARFDAPSPQVRADEGQLEQVIMNLVLNARDAMPTGGKISLRCENGRDADHETVRLVVEDTGTGMSEETKARVFEPFFTTKDPGKGTGLGLATVYGIVTQSGGRIEIDSALGRGTTFTITFPASKADGPATVAAPDEDSAPRGTETILLVEDEAALRVLAERALISGGYTVLSAESGEAALSIARAHPGEIHLVVTDVVMPGMSGPMLVTRLGAIRPMARILYVSGYADDTISNYRLEPSSAFLAKPFVPTTLLRKVRETLDARVASRQPAGAR